MATVSTFFNGLNLIICPPARDGVEEKKRKKY
jgi:hypothetical protein